MDGLKLNLLGRFSAIADGVVVDEIRWPRKRARALLKVLALSPGRRMHREQLIEALSPEADPEAGLNQLHKAIHAARYALEPDLERGALSRFILTQETQVLLASTGITIDSELFEKNSAEALRNQQAPALEAALALYTGDLLEEDLYEDWTSIYRERLRVIHQSLLASLAAIYEQAGDPRSIDVLHRLLLAYPTDEEAHRRAMRLYAGRGQRHLAIEQFKRCSEALAAELDASPEAATVQLYESILDGKISVTQMAEIPSKLEAVPRAKLRWWHVVAAVAAVAAALGLANFSKKPTAKPVLSLAILPLRSSPQSFTTESVADGVTEALINYASRLPGLKVMARSTSFNYKGRSDSWQIGRELKVTYVLSGRIQQQDQRLNVDVELVDVSDGSRAWGSRYSVASKDAPSIEQLVSTELSSALKLKPVTNASPQRSTTNAEAYHLYLTGRQLWNQRTVTGIAQSIENYRQAIERDPGYALAYAGLADSYGLLGFQRGVPREFFSKARNAATRALELDSSLAEAQTALAMVSALYDWNWPVAEARFRRAIDLNPGYVTAHHWLGVHLGAMGRFDEAKSELEKALSLDPLSAIVNLNYGYPELYQRKYGEALSIFNRSLSLNPSFPPAHLDRMSVYELQGKRAEAAIEWLAWLRSEGPPGLAQQIEAAVNQGDYTSALRSSLAAYEAQPSSLYFSPVITAEIAIRLGDPDRAFFWLDRAVKQRNPQLVYLAVSPKYDPIRRDPRFLALLKQIGLPGR